MKTFILSLLIVYVTALSLQQFDPSDPTVSSDDNEAGKQFDLLRLLFHVNRPIPDIYSELKEVINNYKPEEHTGEFKDGGEAAKVLHDEYVEGRMLKKHQVFSLFNQRNREEMLMIFKVLINAKTWNAFVRSAGFYRETLNEGEFVYALYSAITHSHLSKNLILPALYEVVPHFFVNTNTVNEIYNARMNNEGGNFRMNFTGTQKNPEQRIAYFGEDIGLNVHHSTWHMEFPFWWEDSFGHHIDRKGELFYWAHHQLTARFDLERLSNNLNFVDDLYWDEPIEEGFAPFLKYRHGGDFPVRPDNLHFEDVVGVATIPEIKAFETRILDAIAHGYAVKEDGSKVDLRNEKGISIIGDLLEASTYSVNPQYYGSLHNLAHIILGRQADPKGKYGLPPSVMEHFETATRDPSFFRLHKHIDKIFKAHKNSLPPYTKEDVEFPGVAVDSVHVEGELETFFEDFEFEVTNAVDYPGKKEFDFKEPEMKVTVKRINHKPFSLKIDVTNNNDASVFATVRVFLCPLTDDNGVTIPFNERRWACIELDKFWTNIASGSHVVERNMEKASTTAPDTVPYLQMLQESYKHKNDDHKIPSEWRKSCGIPNRLLLPKSKPQGKNFGLFVAITDGKKDAAHADVEKHADIHAHSQCGISHQKFPDNRPLGYPLDRYVVDEKVIAELPNLHRAVVNIKHNDH